MSSNRSLEPSALSLSDLPWQVKYSTDRCTLCGQCTAVCPVQAIELAVFRKRTLKISIRRQADQVTEQGVFTESGRKRMWPMPASVAPCVPWYAPMMPSIRKRTPGWTG